MNGFIVLSNRCLSKNETDIYLLLRESIGYQKETFPNILIPQEDGTVLRKNSELGLVETRSEAEKLIHKLTTRLPDHEWRIEGREYKEALRIEWNRIEQS